MDKKPTKVGSGWREAPDGSGKAPEHVIAATKNSLDEVLRTPMMWDISNKKQKGQWTEEKILTGLEKIIMETGNFPTSIKLRTTGRYDLSAAISQHGGFNYFRQKLGYEPLQKDSGYWTEETIRVELGKIIMETGNFPTPRELRNMGKSDLIHAITKNKGFNHFRIVFGCNYIRKANGYWSYETLIKELNEVIAELGHFPTQQELTTIKRQDLIGAIRQHGGLDNIRIALGQKSTQKQRGYWSYEKIIKELNEVIAELGHFPTQTELNEMGKNGLKSAITRHSSLWQFCTELGYGSSVQSYISELNTYTRARGRKTEKILKELLTKRAKLYHLPEPAYNKKIAPHNVIEFVCSIGKTIGIDVTNTKNKSGQSIRQKYRKKDYHKYVDELWIVVFSNVFTERDYHKFNTESPENVRVMPIEIFLKELDIFTDEHLTSKIDAYKNCTFRTKDEFIKRHLNRSIEDYV